MQIAPLFQSSLVDEVVNRLRGLVEKGGLSTGDQLPSEPELVKRLKVSRTVLREAIGRLEAIGLLKVQRGRGTFVADAGSLSAATQLIRSALAISTRDLLKVAELRRCIETHCAWRAAELATSADIAELDAIRVHWKAAAANHAEAMKCDFQFHHRIAQIAGNDVLTGVLQVIQDFIYAAMLQTVEQPGLPPAPYDLHQELLDAIRAHDPQRAARAAAAHMELVDARLKFVAQKSAQAAHETQS